ncbi:MAG: hypothetical protein FWE54_02120 [Methanimicrococcus sp.]|nr:hypothetical protein [Methanimicrococcus sp.]
MNEEKKAKLRNRSNNKKINETIRTINIVNLAIICGGFLLMVLNTSERLNQIGQGLIIAGALLIFFTIVFQVMMASKMRRGK